MKNGGALERLARGEVLLFDKTGTITQGAPAVADVAVAPGTSGTATTRCSPRARSTRCRRTCWPRRSSRAARRGRPAARAARRRAEESGAGIRGVVEGHEVRVGRRSWIAEGPPTAWVHGIRRRAELDGSTTVFVSLDGVMAGALFLDDPVRPDAARTLRNLRRAGIRRVVLVTGDRSEIAEMVGAVTGVDEVLAERTPAEKVDAVLQERVHGRTIMVGDGVNDAACARSSRRRCGPRRARIHRILGDRRRRAQRRPPRAPWRGDPHLAASDGDRPAERGGGHDALAGGDGRSRVRARCRRPTARSSRRPSTSR